MKRFLRIAALVLLASPYPTIGWSMPEVGEEAPRFTLRELEDASQKVDSRQLFAEKTTLLNFFATWCKPCKAEIPDLRSMAERYGDRGFQVVLVSLDHVSVGEVKSFLEEVGAGALQVLWDNEMEAMALYEVMHLPSNVLVDPSERIRMVWQGHLPGKLEELRAHLQALPKLPAAGPETERTKEAKSQN
jgi:peroxiredoxin